MVQEKLSSPRQPPSHSWFQFCIFPTDPQRSPSSCSEHKFLPGPMKLGRTSSTCSPLSLRQKRTWIVLPILKTGMPKSEHLSGQLWCTFLLYAFPHSACPFRSSPIEVVLASLASCWDQKHHCFLSEYASPLEMGQAGGHRLDQSLSFPSRKKR